MFHDICVLPKEMQQIIVDRAATDQTFKWKPGSVIKIKFLDGEPFQKAWTKKVIEEQIQPLVKNNLTLKFVEFNENADVKMTFQTTDYGTSFIGTSCQTIPQDMPSMKIGNLDCPRQFEYQSQVYTVPDEYPHANDPNENGAILKHEYGHVFSLWHEHQNPINNPIIWDVPKTLEYYRNRYNLTDYETQINIIERLSPDVYEGTPYDPNSIMGYEINPRLTKNNVGVTRNYDYSDQDLYWLTNNIVKIIPHNLTPNGIDSRLKNNPYQNLGNSSKSETVILIILGIVLAVLGIALWWWRRRR